MKESTTTTSAAYYESLSHAELVKCCVEFEAKIKSLETQIEKLSLKLEQLQRKVFGRSSEKFVDDTQSLPSGITKAVELAEPEEAPTEKLAYKRKSKKKRVTQIYG